jgi:hypothetical protein
VFLVVCIVRTYYCRKLQTGNGVGDDGDTKIGPTSAVPNMTCSFQGAINVYLSHKLTTALDLSDKLAAEKDSSAKMESCVEACKAVLRYVHSAQTVCGVLGLLVIDRSEEHLRLCLRTLYAVDYCSHTRTMHSVAGLCYSNALIRHCWRDLELEELWLFAAECADTIAMLNPDQRCEINANINLDKLTALVTAACKSDAEIRATACPGQENPLLGQVACQTARLCRIAVVCAQICDIQDSGKRFLPATTAALHSLTQYTHDGARVAATMIKRFMPHYVAASSSHCAEIQSLFDIVVRRFEEAVKQVSGKPFESPQTQSGGYNQSIINEKEQVASLIVINATCLSSLASALSAVLKQLPDMRADVAGATYLPATSRAVLNRRILMADCADRVQDLLAQVAASATDSSRNAVHVRDHSRLMAAIALVADKLAAAQSAVTSWEEQAVQRFLAKAADVPRDGSPLCAPIVDCWLLAAKLMKLAVDGSAAAGTQADTQLVAHYKACAKNCENLVRGPFSDAVNYLAKSEHSTSSFAGSLWQEAAQLLLQGGVHMMQRADRAGTAENFRRVLVGGQTAMEEVQIRCAAACADCAATMETFTDAEVATLTGSLLLRDKESAADVGPEQTVLQMRYLLVHVERLQLALLISPIVDITWAGMTPSCVVGKLRTVVRDILLLSQTLQVIAPVTRPITFCTNPHLLLR